MKRTLLCTTALAAISVAGTASAVEISAGALSMNVSGFYTTTLAYSSVTTGATLGAADFDGVDIFTNAEIWFQPSLTLDNGIKIAVDVQLEAGSGVNGDQIDESYMTVSGNFGKVIIGSENSVGYKMTIAAPDVSHIFAQSSSLTGFVPYSSATAGADLFRRTLGTTYIENNGNNDAQRLSYFSPTFSGFQFGISYARDAGQGNGAVDNNAVVSDIIDIAATYHGSFGEVDVGVSARYGTASAPLGGQDPEVWGGGLNLTWNGFTLGGSYAEQDGSPAQGGVANARDGRSYDVGLGYASGPWAYSLTYFDGENIDNEAGIPLGSKEQLQTIMLAAEYALSSNFKVGAFVANTDFTEDADPGGVGAGDVEGTVVGVSAKFTF